MPSITDAIKNGIIAVLIVMLLAVGAYALYEKIEISHFEVTIADDEVKVNSLTSGIEIQNNTIEQNAIDKKKKQDEFDKQAPKVQTKWQIIYKAIENKGGNECEKTFSVLDHS